MKPGYQTTEFWVTAANTVITLLATVGLVSSSAAAEVRDPIMQSVGAAVVLAQNAAMVIYYIKGRVALKQGKNGTS